MTGALLAASTSTGHATIPDIITFVVAAAMVLAGAVGVVTSRNPVHAALSLVLTLFGIAVLFVEQNADFLAVVQIIVYAGAIVVLFLFVIMFLGVDRRENIEAEPLRGQRPLAFLMMLVSLGAVFALAVNANWVSGAHAVAGSTTAGGQTNVALLGKSVFTTYLFAFEATAALLVIAVVGAVFLARRPSAPGEVEGEDGEEGAADELGPGAPEAPADEAAATEVAEPTGPETEVEPEPEPVQEGSPVEVPS
ncbi:MAG TPA: NADH-quinone oxidoreductase subunit J [Acidimicrobiales bacterium]|nr:NADH-quinone oxidoreductase subunit J [Acidimicrobiales bacterium]